MTASRWDGEEAVVHIGDLTSVDGLLEYLGVADSSPEIQRAAVNGLYTRGPSAFRPLLDRLLHDLKSRGLMFMEDV